MSLHKRHPAPAAAHRTPSPASLSEKPPRTALSIVLLVLVLLLGEELYRNKIRVVLTLARTTDMYAVRSLRWN